MVEGEFGRGRQRDTRPKVPGEHKPLAGDLGRPLLCVYSSRTCTLK